VQNKSKTTLGLQLPTDPRWVNLAQMDLQEILTDHAYCEQKAATACISLIQLFPDKIELVKQVAPVVTEEWGHFRLVLRELERHNLSLGFQRKDLYVSELFKFKKSGTRDANLIESLLICALIEARSCERFRLLSLHIADDHLKSFYYDFMVAEASHYRMFLDLAILYGGEEKVMLRWKEYLDYEAGIMTKLEVSGERMH
jgi:tRNA 2-(methylsulfanyl)-N6-isopentenyladenosine37 hydroxylase